MRRRKKPRVPTVAEIMAPIIARSKNPLFGRVASREGRQNHTRATFGHRYTGRMVPLDLDGPTKQVPYNPGWEPPLKTLEPNFKMRNSIRYWVIYRYPDKTEKLIKDHFKTCCSMGKTCKKKSCAACWVAFHATPKGVEIIIKAVPSNAKMTIDDPAGVDPQGFRPKGKSLGFDEREMYKLTSTQRRYKGRASSQ